MLNKILIPVILLVSLCTEIFAQTPTCYRIYLKDKTNSQYFIDNPAEFLSQRAIAKRIRFNIPVTEQDLPVSDYYLLQLCQSNSEIQILSTSKWMNTATIYCPDDSIISMISSLSFVDSVLPVASYRLLPKVAPYAKPENTLSSNMLKSRSNYDYGAGLEQIAIHRGNLLHNEGFNGDGMLIAVIDGGWYGVENCDFFNKLIDENRFLGKIDLLPKFDTSYSSPYFVEHGTMVTSVMAAAENGIMVGTAPNASYVFIHSEFGPTEELIEEDFWARAAEIADSIGADVINSSLGYFEYPDFPQANTDFSTFDGNHSIASRCATILAHKGVIVCVAAGNEGNNDWYYISKPADAKDVITVGACSADSVVAGFSSRGYSYDGRVKPDVAAIGVNTACISAENNQITSAGTSLATPVISGLSACLWQALPNYSSLEIMQIIRENSSQFLAPDSALGYGIPDFYNAYLQHVSVPETHKHTISVFPNPCYDYFMIDNKDFEIEHITIFDALGNIVLTKFSDDDSQISININHLSQGIYIGHVLLKDNNRSYFKIIKR